MKNIVFMFSGRAGAGKDTSYKFFNKYYQDKYPDSNIQKYAFGDSLKQIVVDISKLYLGVEYSVESMENLSYKEVPRLESTIFIEGDSQPLVIRKLLQQIGTNILRKNLGDDIFAFSVVRKINDQFTNNENQVAMITDLRFPNEYKCIKKYCEENNYQCVVIYIERPGVNQSAHSSENYFDEIPKDFVIMNDGYIVELELNLVSILKKIS